MNIEFMGRQWGFGQTGNDEVSMRGNSEDIAKIVDFICNNNQYMKLDKNTKRYIPAEEVEDKIQELKNRNQSQAEFIQGLGITEISGRGGYKTFNDLPQAKEQELHIVELEDLVLAAEGENQKLIEQNWKLEKTLMFQRGYELYEERMAWEKYRYDCIPRVIISKYEVGKVIG